MLKTPYSKKSHVFGFHQTSVLNSDSVPHHLFKAARGVPTTQSLSTINLYRRALPCLLVRLRQSGASFGSERHFGTATEVLMGIRFFIPF
jgi:hypothetical protein